jgi:hypothetical protein
MRGLRGLAGAFAGAVALAILAGEARSQYYPSHPYPQPIPYGYGYPAYPGGYSGGSNPYYAPAPPAYSPSGSAPSNGMQYYAPAPAPLADGGQGLGTPPIFPQSTSTQPMPMQPLPQGRYMSPSMLPAQAQTLSPGTAFPSLPPTGTNPATATHDRPIVIPAPAGPSFPRNLPNDPKSAPGVLPEADKTPDAANKNQDDDDLPPLKKPGKADRARTDDAKIGNGGETSTAQPEKIGPPASPAWPAPLPAPLAEVPPADKATNGNGSYFSFLSTPLSDHRPRLWASTEYLLWWEKNAPIGVPLVTFNPNTAPGGAIGALGEPGTTVLLGSGGGQPTVDFKAFSGGRFTVGGWLDSDGIFGLETTGLVLERRGNFFSASSSGGANPIVSLPFFATQPFLLSPAGETSLNAGMAPNTILVSNFSHLWGMEVNGIFNLANSSSFRLVGLIGFRYLNLTESLTVSDFFPDSVTGGAVNVVDSFGTQNHFFGGQVGLRGGCNWNRFTFDGSAKIALGDNSQTLNINGNTDVLLGGFGLTSSNAGLFAEPSNIGHYHHDQFSVVPEFNLQVGYLLTQNVRPFISYNFLLLSRTLRPGDQINRNINPTENATFGGTMGVPVGLPSPLPIMRTSDFWAQGVTFGVEVRY